MASACLNRIGISPENNNYSSYAWFSPRLSIGREEGTSKRISSPVKTRTDLSDSITEDPVKDISDLADEFDGFEFRLDDPVMMLPADELFSDGKLIPLHLSVIRQEAATSSPTVVPDTPCSRRRSTDDAFAADPYLFSPRAPRCSSRWKDLLGFRKLNQSTNNNNNVAKIDNNNNNNNNNNKRTSVSSIRQLLNRSSKSSNDSSINLPLLTDNESVSVSVSSRPSLSSSSSGHDLDDLPRLSLDSDKPGKANTNPNTRPKIRLVKTKTRLQSNQSIKSKSTTEVKSTRSAIRRSADAASASAASRGLSVDSPRMSSSGKIVFHSLERSSSSPSSFNGGPRFKHKGMERSYSANVRITPVLNVPVCSLRGSSKSGTMFGFPMFSSQQKREGCSTNGSGSSRSQRFVN